MRYTCRGIIESVTDAALPMKQPQDEFSPKWWHWIWMIPLLLLVPLYIILFFAWVLAYAVLIRLAIWLWWCPRGKDVLFVYSESPIWQDYIERNMLPVVERRAILLNWSQRKQWRPSLASAAFRHFGGYLNFNPMAIVFRPFGRTRIFRFFKPFHRYKHGDTASLHQMEHEFRSAIGAECSGAGE